MVNENYYPDIKKIIKSKISFADVIKNSPYFSSNPEIYEVLSSGGKHTKDQVNFLSSFIKKYCSGKKFLDLACGVGRHSRVLSSKKFDMTGIDHSKAMLEIAKREDKLTKYFLSDIRSFSVGKNFDAAFCLWSTFNYLSTKEDFTAFLNCVHNALKPNGFLILESKNFFRQMPKLEFRRKEQNNKRFEIELFIRRKINLKNKIQDSIYVYLIKDKKKNKTFSLIDTELMKIYSVKEVKTLIKNKFKLFRVLGDYNMKQNYTASKSYRMVFILQKA
ncbi:class I SAM-dependent methyltransferase [Candidatus Woesearchaeota archaeon]|nr:class I SAM-dependent methyltransferase [Candidatus Woesearchaeota archaeon]